MSKRRLTDEHLSRILGEHSAGQLRAGGAHNWQYGGIKPLGCILQVAFNGNETARDLYPYKYNTKLAREFDSFYRTSMLSEDLLVKIAENE